MTAPRVPGRLLAWAALLTALAASVGANVAFARPAIGPRLSSAVAPVLVVLAAGLLERVPLAGVAHWRRWLAYGGLGVVVVAAFVTSYDHQHALLINYGNTETAAVLLPIAVDGLIVLASVCLTVIAERRRELAASVPLAAPAVAAVEAPAAGPVPAAQPEPVSAALVPLRGAAARVAELLADRPELKAADVATELGIADRTARRHLATVRAALAT